MKALLQRVSEGSVSVGGEIVGSIGKGLVILFGAGRGDTEKDAAWLAEKCVNLRIFRDENGKMNLALPDVGGELLVISQFTLYGDCRKGRRPGFGDAAEPAEAERLYLLFLELLRKQTSGKVKIGHGVFGADMEVKIWNDGPVTFMLETENGAPA